MAYDENTASRVRQFLAERADVTERKMMGGLIFMVGGHMCCGASGDGGLMVRVGPAGKITALEEPFVKPLEIGGGRKPKAFIHVEPEGYASDKSLAAWINRGLEFVATLPPKS